jgi:hypothetical protein
MHSGRLLCPNNCPKGITGKVEVWREGAAYAASTFIAEKAAKLTILESRKEGPPPGPLAGAAENRPLRA